MTSIPPNLVRVPNILSTRLSLGNIARSNVGLLTVQQQLSTGRAILRPSDDFVKAATIGVLDDRLERSAQLTRNLEHASASLSIVDNLLNEATDVTLEAKDIAAEQSNLTSSASERESQAIVVDEMLRAMYNIANRESVAGHVLGGSVTTRRPVEDFLGYFRYTGQGGGLVTDLDETSTIPITLGATRIIGITSRVKGTVNLAPSLTGDTKLADVIGARSLPITLGEVEFSFESGPRTRIDLTRADTVQDVVDAVTSAIRDYETQNSVTILGAGGVSFDDNGLTIDVAPGTPTNPSLQFFDIGNATTSQDFGLTGVPVFSFSAGNAEAQNLTTKLTWRTPINALSGITGALGQVRVTNAGRSAVVDLSTATTLQELKTLLEGSNLGVRVAINPQGTGIDVVNEVSAGSKNALSISEVAGGDTATRLGIRSFSNETRLSEFNHGRGVHVLDGIKDPASGIVSSNFNTDFAITLGDAGSTTVTIDLTPSDVTTVNGVLNAINTQLSTQLAAAGLSPTDLVAGLADDGNGIVLRQNTSFTGPVVVNAKNNSPAAEQLGLLKGTWNSASATFVGQDRATVRVESVFSYLVDLRDSLRTNDVSGMSVAGEDLGNAVGELAETRGLAGSYAQRVDGMLEREADRVTIDQNVRSGLRDVDISEAATRYQLLQTQLQAGLQVTSLSQRLTLLDYLQ